MSFDKERITQKQYQLIMEIMSLDQRRTFNSILKDLAKKETPQKRTFFLQRLKEQALAKKVRDNKKGEGFSLTDLITFQKEIIAHFKDEQVSKNDLDLSQYSSFYGDDIVPILEKQIDIVTGLLHKPEIDTSNYINVKNLQIENKICPYCNISFKESRNHEFVIIFKDSNQLSNPGKIKELCHLKCLLLSNRG